MCREQKQLIKQEGVVHDAPMTGAVLAYLTLSYNLYLLAHNVKVQERLIKHLKNKKLFYGAFYETIVAANFIKAGFKLELEDEYDKSSTHCEFTAIPSKTGNKYSIEAKTRAGEKSVFSIRNQLHKALKKEAKHKRVIFIDLNVPENIKQGDTKISWLRNVLCELRNCESTLTIHFRPAPEAYVFVTNYPILYNLESFQYTPAAVLEGFKIPDMKFDTAFTNLREAIQSRDKHIDMLDLIKAMKEYDEIPCTFDGKIPEYAFGKIKEPRLKIGNNYLVPDGSGNEVVGQLEDAVVLEKEKKVWGVYKLQNDERIIATVPITDEELAVYRKYPNTFFGAYRETVKKAEDALDSYDFCYDVYRNSSKEKLLEFLKGHRDIEKFKIMDQGELAKVFCELLVYDEIRLQSDPHKR
jgi:hypothetical protein